MSDVVAPVIPFLRYRDPGAAIDWLCSAFGFTLLEKTTGGEGQVVHAELRWGIGTFQLGPAGSSSLPMASPRDLPLTSQGVYVYVGDAVDAHHDRAVAAGAEVVMPLTDTDYGSREYVVRDLEGHLWGFGSYAPKLD
ncbi:VOC family protein [Micromonospora sp. NPDC049900]|uniref:VOC family protein n=1 Tax=Micromonospora sp. NPDC049900 TaxID=3364275 RepID=UPI00379CF158